MSLVDGRYPHPDCGYSGLEPKTLKAIYVIECWCVIDDNGTWGWDALSVHINEGWARQEFDEIKRSHFFIRIRKVEQILSLGKVIDHHVHEDAACSAVR
ncbi:MAG: hypothetical protein ISN29_09710 [Gammaproteobacteria bacterium AqS3]|nr:hypothetical protein [Gammaproteobacteria bacterium AqS3]